MGRTHYPYNSNISPNQIKLLFSYHNLTHLNTYSNT